MAWNRLAEGIRFLDSITSGLSYGYHTYSTWGLTMESDDVGFPDLLNNTIDSYLSLQGIPEIDVRTPRYGRRKMVFSFGKKVTSRWPTLINTITAAIHGRKKVIYRDCEPNYVYIGRCYVRAYETTRGIGKIQIEVDAEPYKFKRSRTRVEFTDSTTGFTYEYNGKYITPVGIALEFSGYFSGDWGITCYDYSTYGEKYYEITGTVPQSKSTRAFNVSGLNKDTTHRGPYRVMYRYPVLFPDTAHYFKIDDVIPSKVTLFYHETEI